MKQVKLKSLSLTHFKGHKAISIAFGDSTTISGDNRMGKSSIFDAFTWLLFGKDQFDRKDYEIFPIVDNKRLDRVDAEVVGTLSVDGTIITLKRVFRQQWVRPRGAAEEVYKGNETLFYVNDVPKKAGEYKAVIDGIIDEGLFKLITNPSAFLEMHWTKQREILFQIAGTVSDAEIAASNPKFKALLDTLNGKPLAEFKKEIAARKRKLNEAMNDIQPRIDQTARLMPEAKDFEEIEGEIMDIDVELSAISMKMSDRSEAIRGQYNEIQEKQGKINALKSQQAEIIQQAKTKAQQEAYEANQQRAELEQSVATALRKLKNAEAEREEVKGNAERLAQQVKSTLTEIESLRKRWSDENEREYKGKDGCLICPVFGTECGDPTALGKHQEAQEKAKAAFMSEKEVKLEAINELGKSKVQELETLNQRMEAMEANLKQLSTDIETLDREHDMLKQQLDSTPIVQPKAVKPEELSEWVKLAEEISAIEATISEVKPVDNSDILPRKQELSERRDNLKQKLTDRETIARLQQEVKRLHAEGSSLVQQISDLEQQEFTVAEFTRAKIEESEGRINGLFKIVRFKLFDKTIDGNEFECCIATNKAGVPISATNTAEQINAGLDIINTLTQFFGAKAPIFCDRAESVNEYITAGSQMVFLRVTKEKTLSII